MDAALAVLPQAGVAGVLVFVIAILLRANHADRSQYSQLRTTHDAAYDQDLRDLREDNKQLRTELESERARRRQAEEDEHKARLRLAELSRRYGVNDHE